LSKHMEMLGGKREKSHRLFWMGEIQQQPVQVYFFKNSCFTSFMLTLVDGLNN
jgi:hypothetical protein